MSEYNLNKLLRIMGNEELLNSISRLLLKHMLLFLESQGTEDVRVAVAKSSPVVVRGRSPGHYSDISFSRGRTDNETTHGIDEFNKFSSK